MARIDAHQHFWNYDPIRDSWIAPDMSPIKRDFLPEDIEPILKKYDFDGCIVVQSDQSEMENTFQLKNAEQHPFIKGIVGWTDLMSPQLEEKLQEYKKQPLIKGFRHVLQAETDKALILQTDFREGLHLLAKYNFTYDVLIYPDQLRYLKEFLKTSGEVDLVLDHIAKPNIKTGDIDDWCKYIQKVAEFENISCKVSGMVTEADWQNWKYEDFVPYLDIVFNAFGIERLMYGSDWPVCEVAGGYDRMLSIVQQYTALLTASEQSQFWGDNAANFYHLTE